MTVGDTQLRKQHRAPVFAMGNRGQVVWLRAGGGATAELVGGKGFGLQQLATFGLPIPPAFCLTVAAQRRYLEAAGYLDRLPQLLAGLPAEEAREELEAIAFEAPLPGDVERHLRDALDGMTDFASGRMLAVRSSSVDEDGAERSFAGQHDTVLGVFAGGVEAAVRVCWASLWSQRAIAYRTAHGLSYPHSQMAVVVQELIDAQTSAIAFSLDPVSGRRDCVMITAAHGLGEPIVAGTVNPDTAVLAKHSLELLSYHTGDKTVRVVPRSGGGVMRVPGRASEPATDLSSLRELAKLVIAAEAKLGIPVDVEAARDERGWHLVQLRPALLPADEVPAAGGQHPRVGLLQR